MLVYEEGLMIRILWMKSDVDEQCLIVSPSYALYFWLGTIVSFGVEMDGVVGFEYHVMNDYKIYLWIAIYKAIYNLKEIFYSMIKYSFDFHEWVESLSNATLFVIIHMDRYGTSLYIYLFIYLFIE